MWRLAGPVAALILALILMFFHPSIRPIVDGWLGLEKVPAEKRLAVLPFTSIGDDPNNQAFCDGLVEYLTLRLTQLEQFDPSFRVQCGRRTDNPTEAWRRWGVNVALLGSVRREDRSIRLAMDLVDARTLRGLGSTVIEDHIANVSVFQDTAVARVVGMLEVEFQPAMVRALSVGRTTAPHAFDLYLQGMGRLNGSETSQDTDAAIGLLEQALEKDAGYTLAYAALGEAYWDKYEASKDVQWERRGVESCERAIELNNRVAPVRLTLGCIHEGMGRFEEAAKEFQQALKIDRVNAAAFIQLADTYKALGELPKAELTYKKATELRPTDPRGYNHLAFFYYGRGQYEDAAAQYRQAVLLTPENYAGYRNLGVIYRCMDRWEDAHDTFERSLEIKPNYGAYTNLATLYYEASRYVDAAEMYKRALEIDSSDHRAWGNLASSYRLTPGEDKKAVDAYRRAAEIAEEQRKANPRDPVLLSGLAGYCRELGEVDRAVRLLEQAIAIAPENVEVMFLAASNYEQMGEREQALEWIRRALEHGYPQAQIENEPSLRRLCADPRFQELLRRRGNES